jgi:hypothetical protein
MSPDCLHCQIMGAIGKFCERHYEETGTRVNTLDIIDHLITATAEFAAFVPDDEAREKLVRQISNALQYRVPAFRAEGRYPGGRAYTESEYLH